jgi:hypothetical protein
MIASCQSEITDHREKGKNYPYLNRVLWEVSGKAKLKKIALLADFF